MPHHLPNQTTDKQPEPNNQTTVKEEENDRVNEKEDGHEHDHGQDLNEEMGDYSDRGYNQGSRIDTDTIGVRQPQHKVKYTDQIIMPHTLYFAEAVRIV